MARVKPGGWGQNEKLLSSQATALDENIDALATLVAGPGVKRQQTYTTKAALRAVTGYADGDIVFVAGFGPYRFDAASTGNTLLYERPDNILLANPGRWVSMMAGWYSQASGLAALDAAARVPAATVRNGILENRQEQLGGIYTPTGTPAVVPGSELVTAVALEVGDILDLQYDCSIDGIGTLQLSANARNSVNAESQVGYTREYQGNIFTASCFGRYVCTVAGTITVWMNAAKTTPPDATIRRLAAKYEVRRP